VSGARIGSSGPFATSTDVLNDSGVAGATVTDALDALASGVAALTSSGVANASGVPGATVTDALDALASDVAALQPATIVSQIGWTPPSGGSSNVLTLLAAGHEPGLYTISWNAIVRTVGTGGALACTLGWHSPAGAESRTIGQAMSWAALGTIVSGAGSSQATVRELPVLSDGTAAITLQFSAGTITAGNPVADLYAAARLQAV
jgi:hypothetical protein